MRDAPSGPFEGICRVSTSAAFAYSSGVTKVIPFDQVDYNRGDFAELFNPAFGGEINLALAPGLYAVQLQVRLGTGGATTLQCQMSSGETLEEGAVTSTVAQFLSTSANGFFPATLAPLNAANPRIFVGLSAAVTVAATGTATAQMLIQRIANLR
jgi:hypothetical protein